MDFDSQEDSGSEVPEPTADSGELEQALRLPPNRQVETIPDSPGSNPFKEIAHSAKWSALKASYRSKYLELFQETWHDADNRIEVGNLDASQHGAVIWHAEEKSRLFGALERHGRRNLRALSDAISTKSQVEVKAYLEVLQQAELDRQLYYRQTGNAVIADIPAAVEIGTELEASLDEAAASLEAYQEQYDYAVAARGCGSDYIIDSHTAQKLDEKTDSDEQQLDEVALDNAVQNESPRRLFKLSHLVRLSTNLFMIGSAERRNQDSDHWKALAFGEETPAVTQDAISDLFAIVTSLTQRLVQTILFIAESRLRATTTRHWHPQRQVKTEDVQSALQILNCDGSLWKYWVKLPRRRGFKIWSGSHRKGAGVTQAIDIDTAEEMLSKRSYRGRNSRSASIDSSVSISTSSLTSMPASHHSSDMIDSLEDEQSPTTSNGDADTTDSTNDASVSSNDMSSEGSDEEDWSEDNLTDADGPQPLPSNTVKASLSKRKRILEKELTQYMKELDAQQSVKEQRRIEDILDIRTENRIKEESEPPRKRPKVLRKTAEEVKGWHAPSLAAWEVYEFPAHEMETTAQQGQRGIQSRSLSATSI